MRSVLALLALSIAAATLAGCGSRVAKPTANEDPEATTWQPPASPLALVDSLESSWRNQDSEGCTQLFAADFVFRRAENDSGPWRQIHREQELMAADALFNGAPGRPAAASIELERLSEPLVGPDPRPGKLSPWHRSLTADYDLTIRTSAALFRVITRVTFYAVRGDSAAIPEDLADLGAGPDPSRWYLERWQELGPAVGLGRETLRALPPGPGPTWARIKEMYLGPPPPATGR